MYINIIISHLSKMLKGVSTTLRLAHLSISIYTHNQQIKNLCMPREGCSEGKFYAFQKRRSIEEGKKVQETQEKRAGKAVSI